MKDIFRAIIVVGLLWAAAMHAENMFIHAYYRGLTVPHSIREKLTAAEIAEIAERTELQFQHSWFSWLGPVSLIALAGYGLWKSKKENPK